MAESTTGLDRRTVLRSLGAAGALTGVAGCMGGEDPDDGDDTGDDTDDGDLGERVPAVPLQYWADVGAVTQAYEDQIPTIQESWAELGIEVDPYGEAYASIMGNLAEDQRERRLTFFTHNPDPARVDPDEMLKRWGIHRAGNTPSDNPSQYANCEYTDLAFEQGTIGELDRRTEVIHDAIEKRSEDMYCIPTVRRPMMSVYNADRVELGGVGDYGATYSNNHIFRESEALEDGEFTMSVNPTALETLNYYTNTDTPSMTVWSRIVNQPLLEYDPQYELRNVLADSVEEENEGRDVVVTLRDATFHNGDPITAEDVKFTFDLVMGNPGSYPMADEPLYDEIEVVDDETVVFTGEDPDPVLQTRRLPGWGILHRESWVDAGVLDAPGEAYPEEVIGSGVFQVTSFDTDQAMRLEPHEGHPLYGEEDAYTPEHSIICAVYADEEAMVQSFLGGELDVAIDVTAATIDRIEDEDWAAASVTPAWTSLLMYIEMASAPTKFPEFREALGMSVNRQHINQLVYGDRAEPSMRAELWEEGFPFLPEEDRLTFYTDDPTGDVEGARQLLEENGWGWDDDGNLHYPPDADLEPVWPEGERPSPDDFDCMEDVDGESLYVRPNGEPYEH